MIVANSQGSVTSTTAGLIVAEIASSGDDGTLPAGWPNKVGTSTKAVGLTSGQLSVDKSGALTYSIPLWVVPGTAGMEPKLALNYSSQSGSGIAGFGWSLGGVSAITRGPQTMAVDGQVHGVDFSAQDRFYLDGQRLIAISGADGGSGTEYRTEIDSVSKIVSYSSAGTGPGYFKVWTKAGLIIEFGNTTDSAAEATGRSEIMTWAVNKISDTAGNYLTFSYYEDSVNGEQRVTEIDYTGNTAAALSAYASVRFTYEVRNDAFSGYVAGSMVSRSQRLKTITAYYGATAVRKYTLDYINRDLAPGDGLGRSILNFVHEADGSGTEYPTLAFDYDSTVAGFDQTNTWNLPGLLAKYNDTPRGTGFVDLNGDGRPDFIQYHNDSSGATVERGAWLNTVTGWIAADTGFNPPFVLAQDGVTDGGTRLADVNGDGLTDMFDIHGTCYTGSSTGFVMSPDWSIPLPAGYAKYIDAYANYSKPTFLDLNGDGRVDFIAKATIIWDDNNNLNTPAQNTSGTDAPTQNADINTPSGHHVETVTVAWLNTGSGWAEAPGYYPQLDMEKGSAFIDVNGDGLPDQVQSWRDQGTVIQNVALNTGTGWNVVGSSSVFVPPEMITWNSGGTDSASDGTEFVDLNGDGLVDIIHRNDVQGYAYGTRAWLNTGNGWVAAPTGFLPPFELAHDNLPQGVALLDVNSDGLPDVVQAGNTSLDVRLGTGGKWGNSASSFNVLRQIAQPNIGYTGTDFIDINGDGAIDQIWSWQEGNGSFTKGAAINRAKPADHLTKVTNGFGVAASITYAPLTERDSSGAFTVYDKGTGGPTGSVNVLTPLYVVKTVKNDDGTGTTYDINYRYGGMRADFLRGNLGFEWMRTTDARTSISSTTWFKQQFPYIGMPYLAQTKKANGTTLSQTTTTYAALSLNSGKTQLPYASEVVQESFELDGTFISGTDTATTEIDDYGNATSIYVGSIDSDGSPDGFSKTTTSVFAPADTANWILGRLMSSTVVATAPGKPTLTRTSSFDYDPTTHLLTQEVVEPDDTTTLKLTTVYGYDSFGNKQTATVTGKDVNAAGQTVSSSRITTTVYDTKGRFPDHSLNALNHREDYVYDQQLGVMTSLTGPNSLPTTWQYDTFGNKTHESRADGTATDVGIKWAGTGAPTGALYFVETTATGAAPSLVFHDAMGRVIRAVALDGNANMIYQDTSYDNIGRANLVSMPYRSDSATVYYTQTTSYDLLNRPLTVQTPDDQNGAVTTTFVYKGLTTDVTDAKNRLARTVKNSQGWVVTAIRDVNGIAATVTTDYDAFGDPTSTKADGATTSMVYDARGRKTSMTDPDMGAWSYGYNAFGELISQTDAKTQTSRMAYDGLGRLFSRTEAEGTTTWTYDTAVRGTGLVWKGKLSTVAAPGSYGETYSYDPFGRPHTVSRTIDGTPYTISQLYDSSGRPETTVYPTGFQAKNVYNAFGFIKEVHRVDSGHSDLYWRADSYAVDGRVDGDTLGNGLTGDRVYSPATGRLLGAAFGLAPGSGIQFLTYAYDPIGNVMSRNDGPTGRSETFLYDTLDRLTSHALAGGATVGVNYDVNGNVLSKSDVGNYSDYGTNAGPHAVTGISGGPLGAQSYSYDSNGNMTSGGGRTLTWTSFNQVKTIAQGTASTQFFFGAAHERVKQVAVNGTTTTTLYIGGIFELATSSGGTEEKNYVMTPAGRVAVYTAGTYALPNVRYFHTDGLGSITAVTDEGGNVVKRFAFDAWGKRIDPATGAAIISTTDGHFTRGYTDHEHLDDLGLIHMNGRIYDPVLGRFLSADPNVDGAYDSQGYNRYSYVQNNPLNAIDPSGYFSWRHLFGALTFGAAYFISPHFFNTYGGQITGIVVAFAVTVITGNPVLGGMAGGFVSGFSSSILNGGSIGDAFRSGVIGGAIGGVMGEITGGIGKYFGPIGTDVGTELGRALAHGVVGGALSEMLGGDFRHGFLAGFAGSIGGSVAPNVGLPGYGDTSVSAIAVRTTFAAVVGGTASALGGGKFANGAATAAFQHLFNAEGQNLIKPHHIILVAIDSGFADDPAYKGKDSPTIAEDWENQADKLSAKYGVDIKVTRVNSDQGIVDFIAGYFADKNFVIDLAIVDGHGGTTYVPTKGIMDYINIGTAPYDKSYFTDDIRISVQTTAGFKGEMYFNSCEFRPHTILDAIDKIEQTEKSN